MTRKKKRVPADYPQMNFRVGAEDKRRLNELAKEVQSQANRGLSKEFRAFRKNEILVDALFLGLISLKKRFKLSQIKD